MKRKSGAIGTTRSTCPTAAWRSRWATSRDTASKPPSLWERCVKRSVRRPWGRTARPPCSTASTASSRCANLSAWVTAIFGFYDPESSALSYAVAGHPPPLLSLASGFVRRLAAGGLPLGCADALEAIDWTVTLPAGSSAAFYTDGGASNRDDAAALLLSRSDPGTRTCFPQCRSSRRSRERSSNTRWPSSILMPSDASACSWRWEKQSPTPSSTPTAEAIPV